MSATLAWLSIVVVVVVGTIVWSQRDRLSVIELGSRFRILFTEPETLRSIGGEAGDEVAVGERSDQRLQDDHLRTSE